MRPAAVALRAASLTFVLATATTPLLSQSVRGTVRNGNTGEPVVDASVVLLDHAGAIERGVLSAPDGAFLLVAPAGGTYTIQIGAAGFLTRDTPPFQLSEGVEDRIFVLLDTEIRSGRPVGFVMRMTLGEGYFVTKDQIDRHSSARFTEVLQFTDAVAVIPLPTNPQLNAALSEPSIAPRFSMQTSGMPSAVLQHSTVRFKSASDIQGRAGIGACVPVLWVDGVCWGGIDGVNDAGSDGVLAPGDLEAIEIYSTPSILPAQFSSGLNRLCGVIVVWTKRPEGR